MPKEPQKSRHEQDREKEAAAAERRRQSRAVQEAKAELVYDVTLTHHEIEMLKMKLERLGSAREGSESRLLEKLHKAKGRSSEAQQASRGRTRT